MRASDLLSLAWTGLSQNKIRSGLTAVGVTVGVFALTTIIAMGGGLEQAIVDQLTDDESQTRIVIRPGFGPMERRDAKIEGVTDLEKIDRLKKSISKRRRGGPAQMQRTLLTVDALRSLRARAHVTDVRPLAIDRFKLTFDREAPHPASSLGRGDDSPLGGDAGDEPVGGDAGGATADDAAGAPGGRDDSAVKPLVLDGALSFGVVPTTDHWNRRVIHGERLDAAERGIWLHEYMLYRWGFRSEAEQAAVVGETIRVSRPHRSNSLSAMLAAARANGIEIPVSDEAAQALFKTFAGRMNPGGQAQVSATLDQPLELTIRGVIRERIESDGFEIWEDSFSMQADMFLPQKLAEELFERDPANLERGYNAASIEIDSIEHVQAVEKALRKKGFRTVSIDTILDRVSRVMAVITSVVSGLTAIALIVAILGIVNTMVMNVSERTKEIGILKALGASDGQVRALFLVESGIIGLAGGLTGVALSLLASIPGDYFTRRGIQEATHYSFDGTIFSFEPWLITVAMTFAVGLSVLAALGPATRASRVDPTVALRDE